MARPRCRPAHQYADRHGRMLIHGHLDQWLSAVGINRARYSPGRGSNRDRHRLLRRRRDHPSPRAYKRDDAPGTAAGCLQKGCGFRSRRRGRSRVRLIVPPWKWPRTWPVEHPRERKDHDHREQSTWGAVLQNFNLIVE